MSWYILAAINVVFTSIAALFQKRAMNNDTSDPVASSIVFQFLLGCITLAYAMFRGFHVPDIHFLPFFLISGILYAAGTIAFFHAYKLIEASEIGILSGFGSVMAIIGAYIFLHNVLSPYQFVGAALVIFAVVIINLTKSKLKLNNGAWLTILGTSSYGLANVCDAYIVKSFDAVSYLAIMCFIPGVLIYLRYSTRTKAIVRAVKHIDRNLFIFTVLYAVQAVAFYMALSSGALVAQLNVIIRASIILTVVLATVFLKEHDRLPRKIVAAILTTIGVLLVSR